MGFLCHVTMCLVIFFDLFNSNFHCKMLFFNAKPFCPKSKKRAKSKKKIVQRAIVGGILYISSLVLGISDFEVRNIYDGHI